MKLKCLLVDDEPPALKILTSYMESLGNLELVGECFNIFEAMDVLQAKPVDVIFLDIQMPRLLGTEFIRTLRNPPKVIFTTAHKDYALEGYELNAVDYLLKPFSLERFIRAINKITPETADHPSMPKEPPVPEQPFFYFKSDRKMIKVALNEILYIESLKDYIRIIRADKGPLLVKQPISHTEEMLPAHLFIRIHRSYIVSLDKVTAYTQQGVEISGIELPVGKLYRRQLQKLTNFSHFWP